MKPPQSDVSWVMTLMQQKFLLQEKLENLKADIWIKLYDKNVQFILEVHSMTVAEYLYSKQGVAIESVSCFIKDSQLYGEELSHLTMAELSTSPNYPLHVQKTRNKAVPKPISLSAGAVGRTKKPDDIFEEHPVYHWTLAYELKKAYEEASRLICSGNSTITLTVLEDEFSVSKNDLQTAANYCTQALNIADDEPYQFGMRSSRDLACQEICSSATCTVALNSLIGSEKAFILHQGATKKTPGSPGDPETSDLYGAVYTGYKICTPFLVGDVNRPGEYLSSLTRTAKYAHDIISIRHDDDIEGSPILLGLPICKDAMSLYLFLMGQGKTWGMCIAKSDSKYLPLYATFYAASHYTIKHHRVQTANAVENPSLYCLTALTDRVFKDEKEQKAWKFFNTSQKIFRVNWDLWSVLFREQKITHEIIGPDLEVVKYNYIKGDEDPQYFSQYSGVLSMLHQVHEAGYVHGDIRDANMVFRGDTSFLIDFDLAREEGQKYPFEYRYDSFLMRHRDARPFNEMKKAHDRHSLCSIMKKYRPQTRSTMDIISRVDSGESLKKLADELDQPDWNSSESS